MAMNNYGKIFTVPFKSLNNTDCRVDIYQYNASMQQPITLTPADNPFFYEEDKDSDLLNNTVRYKTGYLRLIETETQSLSTLYPSSDTQMYVEFYYGARLDFVGFLQAQDFNNAFTAFPRVVEFAVASPLWVLSNRRFTGWDGYTKVPKNLSLGELLDEVVGWLNLYTHIMFPYFSDIQLDKKIFSQVIAPWNNEFLHSVSGLQDNPAYSPIKYGEFLDALCKAFGWIVHDDVAYEGNQQRIYLTFSMFDFTDTYATYPVGHIGDTSYLSQDGPNGGATEPVLSHLTFADNDATEGQIMPYNRIIVNYDGEFPQKARFEYLRTLSHPDSEDPDAPGGISIWNNQIYVCWLTGLIALSEMPYTYMDSLNAADGRFSSPGPHVLAFYTANNRSVREGIAYALKDNAAVGDTMFTVRLYTKFTNLTWLCEYSLESGENLNTIASDDTDHRYGGIYITQEIGNGYIDFKFKISKIENKEIVPGSWIRIWSECDVMFFSNIEFTVQDVALFEPYITKTQGFDIIQGNTTAFEDGEITMPISMYRNNSNQIGTQIRTTKVTEYSYLLHARRELNAAFRINSPILHPWLKKWSYYYRTWRIIATTFEPWNDKLILTMESSQIL